MVLRSSNDWPEIVVAGQFQIFLEARIGGMRLEQLNQLIARHPLWSVSAVWRQNRNWLSSHGDNHALACLNPLKQVGGFVPQLACRYFYDSATIVASSRPSSPLGFSASMLLYTCGQKTSGPAFAHPCAKAGKALDAAGYTYELKVMGGYRLMPWTWGSRDEDRAEVKRLSGTNEVPILVLDDGEVISGSSTIARWAQEHPAARSAATS
jgi:Glutathione S-transferase, N-terminal domain